MGFLATGDKIRIGFIGVGNIAQNAIMPAYLKQPDVEIVAVCDPEAAGTGSRRAARHSPRLHRL